MGIFGLVRILYLIGLAISGFEALIFCGVWAKVGDSSSFVAARSTHGEEEGDSGAARPHGQDPVVP